MTIFKTQLMKATMAGIALTMSDVMAQLMAETTPPSTSANTVVAASAPTDPFIKKDAVVPAEETGPISNFILTVEVYTLSQADGSKLILESDTDQARHGRALELVKGGKARLDAVLSSALQSGQQSVVEQVNVMSYPIAFNNLPGKGAVALDFKHRNVGYRLVFKGQATPDRKQFNMVMFSENCRFKGFSNLNTLSEGSNGVPYEVPLAQFDNRRVNAIPPTLPCDEVRFLGTYSPAPQGADLPKTTSPNNQTQDSEMTLVFGKVSQVQLTPGTPTGNSPVNLEQQFSLYSMDREQARQILSQKQEMDSAYQAVQALVKANQAKLEHLSVLRTNSGVKSNFDEITEVMYPTGGAGQFTTQDVGFGGEVRTAFIGHTSLMTVDVTKCQLLSYLQNLPMGGPGLTATQTQPLFGLQSLVTTINSGMGEHELLGTLSPAGDTGLPGQKDNGRVWMEFIKTTAVNP